MSKPPRRRELALALLLLGAQVLASASAADRWSLTYDEHLYLPAGWSYWTQHDFRMSREHPPLTKLVAGLPLLGMDLRFAASAAIFARAPIREATWDQYVFGQVFLTEDNADRLDEVVGRSRRAMLGFALLFSLTCWRFARELWGPAGGLLALALAVANPDVLGHGPLVTNDLPMAAFLAATVWLFVSHVRRPSVGKLVGLGLALGAGFATKYSSLLALPLLGLLVLAAWWDPEARAGEASLLRPFGAGGGWARTRWIAASVGLALALALSVVWASYLFVETPWSWARGATNVYGLAVPGYEGFLLGEYRLGPFWHYYLVALGVKLPLGTLLVVALACGFGLQRRERWRLLEGVALVVPPLAVVVAMTLVTLQIGHRYVFAAYPFLLVGAGALGPAAARFVRTGRDGLGALAVLGVLATAAASLLAWPWYLSHSNALVRSDLAFFEVLDAANNDWQQGWRELARRQRLGELGPVFLFKPELERERFSPYGIRHVPLQLRATQPAPGTYAFSAFRWSRARKSNRARGVHAPLLEDVPVRDVVGGCVFLLDVPEVPVPPPPGNRATRERRDADGALLERWEVVVDGDGREVRHGPYAVMHEAGSRAGGESAESVKEEGTYAHGEVHGVYRRFRPDGKVTEEGSSWNGRLHGRVVRFDPAGRVTQVWHYLDGTPVSDR